MNFKLFNISSNNKLWLDISIWSVFSICTAIGIFHHESWRDEAQKWLIVRDLNFYDIIKFISYEGHPILWYLVLYPFAKLGLPYFFIKIVNWMFINVSAFLLIRFVNINWLLKVLLCFSYMFLFEYALIATNYSITFCLIIILSILYKSRFQYPYGYTFTVILASYSHIMVLGFLLALSIYYLYESYSKLKISVWVILISIFMIGYILLYFQMKKQPDALFGYPNIHNVGEIYSSIINGIISYANSFNNLYIFQITNLFSPIIVIVFFVFLLIFLQWDMTCLLICFIGFYVIVISFYYGTPSVRHFMLIVPILVFLFDNNKKQIHKVYGLFFGIFIGVLLLFEDVKGINKLLSEIKYSFSGSTEMANYINDKVSEKDIIIAYPCYTTSSIIPYLKNINQFWYPEYYRKSSFVNWNGELWFGFNLNAHDIFSRYKKTNIDSNTVAHFLCPKEYYLANLNLLKMYPIEYKNKDYIFEKQDEDFILILISD
ncbi:MAG: hypothetical protein NW207_08905 [Cytophagales bacterium]|nr:hypothetical protein [Cytophagales bacterium]